jgi:hypothetical protein
MPFTLPYSTPNLTSGYIPPLRTPIIFLPCATPVGIPTYATILHYSYNGHEPTGTSLTLNTMDRPDVAWKQQSEEGVVLQSAITMPTKNFFLSLSLAPTHSSLYSCPAYPTGMSLNCQCQDYCPATGTLLNCTSPFSPQSSGTTLNCNLAQTSHDMPSGHVGHLGHLRHLRHWTYCGMPSGPYVILGHLRQLGHPGHLGHLGHLDPSPLEPALTDSLPGAFITEVDPMDPCLSEGRYADDSLDPLIPIH